ncbi:zinc_finger and SCAN domain-containing protein [Hexamita inflata]|uniref:Zinc finger and SCAN domain-containing protein n=1 Tax=Hexamita inflata TaxID=28002 RepID=A0AA86R2D4_9EUKA|nr:zinc finger and SCAN domain-containing protein [Hexamita inflata]CAI9964429.1 zinc finger and SCAN domain-containing protein [Hexamita inflata]
MQQQDNSKNTKPREFKCRTCSAVLDTHDQLTEHIKTHPIICKQCQNTFQTTQELKMHLETAHEQKTEAKTKIEEFKCQTCPKSFSTQKALNAHIQKEHQVVKQPAITFKCQYCAQIFQTVKELSAHNKQEHPVQTVQQPQNENKTDQKVKEIICEKCKEIFNNRKELNIHKSQKHPQCFKCKIEFETVEQLEQHKLLQHPDVPKAAENEPLIKQAVQKQEKQNRRENTKQDAQPENPVKKPNGKNREKKQSKVNGKQALEEQTKQDNTTVKAKNQLKVDKKETKQPLNTLKKFVALTARIIVYLDNRIEENNLLTHLNKLNKSIQIQIKEDSQLLVDCDVIDLEDVKQQIISYQKILKYTIIIYDSILYNNTNSYVNNQQQTQINNNTSCKKQQIMNTYQQHAFTDIQKQHLNENGQIQQYDYNINNISDEENPPGLNNEVNDCPIVQNEILSENEQFEDEEEDENEQTIFKR